MIKVSEIERKENTLQAVILTSRFLFLGFSYVLRKFENAFVFLGLCFCVYSFQCDYILYRVCWKITCTLFVLGKDLYQIVRKITKEILINIIILTPVSSIYFLRLIIFKI